MGRINIGRVLLGGLIAGLVINVGEFILNEVVLGAQMREWFQRFNLPEPGGSTIAVFLALGFTLGIVTIWLYAAIRPRYGPGPKTAACAGLTAWYLACVYPNLFLVALGMVPARLMTMALLWEMVEVTLAAVAGAWLYQEEATPARV